MHGQVLAAFGAWLKLDPELSGLADEALVAHPLVLALLAALQGQEHFEAAVDAVMELIYCSSIMMHHSTAPARYMPLVQLLVLTVGGCPSAPPAPCRWAPTRGETTSNDVASCFLPDLVTDSSSYALCSAPAAAMRLLPACFLPSHACVECR